MRQTGASSSRPRLLAVISSGDGPHLVAPTVAAYRSRMARPRVSLEDELALCLAKLDEHPEEFERAVARWHARWRVELTTLTVAETHTALTLLRAIAGPRGVEAARTLRYMCLIHGQTATAHVLRRWIAQREPGHS
jgi:hypothetical protein